MSGSPFSASRAQTERRPHHRDASAVILAEPDRPSYSGRTQRPSATDTISRRPASMLAPASVFLSDLWLDDQSCQPFRRHQPVTVGNKLSHQTPLNLVEVEAQPHPTLRAEV